MIKPPANRSPALCAAALAAALALASCGGTGSVAVSDTYCRDTFYWRTSARDTEPTRQQADKHNSRRLCRCGDDCPKPGDEAPSPKPPAKPAEGKAP